MFDGDVFTAPMTNYPSYNISQEQVITHMTLKSSLAGFGKKDTNVEYAENTLTIKSVKNADEGEEKDGVVPKAFPKTVYKVFTIADDVEVKGAELKDGLLRVSHGKNYSREQKPKTIDIK